MERCDRNCFDCKFPDCIIPDREITKEERQAIKERDRLMLDPRVLLVRGNGKAKHRHNKQIYV